MDHACEDDCPVERPLDGQDPERCAREGHDAEERGGASPASERPGPRLEAKQAAKIPSLEGQPFTLKQISDWILEVSKGKGQRLCGRRIFGNAGWKAFQRWDRFPEAAAEADALYQERVQEAKAKKIFAGSATLIKTELAALDPDRYGKKPTEVKIEYGFSMRMLDRLEAIAHRHNLIDVTPAREVLP